MDGIVAGALSVPADEDGKEAFYGTVSDILGLPYAQSQFVSLSSDSQSASVSSNVPAPSPSPPPPTLSPYWSPSIAANRSSRSSARYSSAAPPAPPSASPRPPPAAPPVGVGHGSPEGFSVRVCLRGLGAGRALRTGAPCGESSSGGGPPCRLKRATRLEK